MADLGDYRDNDDQGEEARKNEPRADRGQQGDVAVGKRPDSDAGGSPLRNWALEHLRRLLVGGRGAEALLGRRHVHQRLPNLVGRLHDAVADAVDRGLPGSDRGGDDLLGQAGRTEVLDGL